MKVNSIDTSMIKRSTILFGKNKNAEFDIIDYQHLIGKLIYLL